MKSTGIIRRIDDLGRVVIPKEIRRTLMIREGDPLEIFVLNGMVCYQKYIPQNDYIEVINGIISNVINDDDIENRAEVVTKLKYAISALETDKINFDV